MGRLDVQSEPAPALRRVGPPANSIPEVTPKDFKEMVDDGFSRDEIQEIIGLAVFWVQNTMFNTAATMALSDA